MVKGCRAFRMVEKLLKEGKELCKEKSECHLENKHIRSLIIHNLFDYINRTWNINALKCIEK